MPPNIPELSNTTTDQVPLTTDLVQRLIDSWPEMSALASDFTDQYGIDEDAPDPAAVFGSWASHPEAKAKIDAVIAKHGFKDLDEWTKVANSILIAYDWDDDLVDPKKIEEAVHDIDKTPGLSQAEKDALIAQSRSRPPPPRNPGRCPATARSSRRSPTASPRARRRGLGRPVRRRGSAACAALAAATTSKGHAA